MKHRRIKLPFRFRGKVSLLLMLLLVTTILKGQQVITITGKTVKSSGGALIYSMGQTNYSAKFNSSGSVVQGLMGGFEISPVASTIDTPELAIKAKVFPNPVEKSLTLEIDENISGELHYQLIDINGKVLLTNPVNGNRTEINMPHMPSGNYFLKISGNPESRERKMSKTFKIIKNH